MYFFTFPVTDSCETEAATGGAAYTALLKKRLWHRCFPVNFANI